MKKATALVAIVLSLGMGLALDAEAKRLGGGKSAGMQRQSVNAPANTATPSNGPSQAAPAAGSAAAAPGAAAAAVPRRSWMGPIAGIAAGLGLAALASHFGFGEALANMMTIALVVFGVLLLVGFIMRKRAQGQGPSLAGAGGPSPLLQPRTMERSAQGGSMIGSQIGSGVATGAAAVASPIPADFDVPAFVRNAKAQFLALQAANDVGDLARLREYLTPDMLELVRGEIAERGSATQKTEVFGLEAQVLEVVEEAGQYVVSVRFTGSIRDQAGAAPDDLDETWHLVKPRTGLGGWVIAGIQQGSVPA